MVDQSFPESINLFPAPIPQNLFLKFYWDNLINRACGFKKFTGDSSSVTLSLEI